MADYKASLYTPTTTTTVLRGNLPLSLSPLKLRSPSLDRDAPGQKESPTMCALIRCTDLTGWAMRRGALSRLLSFTPSVQPVALVGGSSSAGRPKITGKRFQTELLGDNRSLFAGFFDAPPRGPVAIDPAPVWCSLPYRGDLVVCVFL